MKFGDELEPVAFYADNIRRKFIFMNWMTHDLKGYARVATVIENGKGYDDQGRWVDNFGLVLMNDTFVHKSKIKKLGMFKKIIRIF